MPIGFQYQMISLENMYTNNNIQTEKGIFTNVIYTYMYIYMVNKNDAMNLSKNKESYDSSNFNYWSLYFQILICCRKNIILYSAVPD